MPEPGTPDGDQPTDARADEATADVARAEAARASGSAAVPPSPPKRRKWLDDESAVAPPPPPPDSAVKRDPTLELPLEERLGAESVEPVDPWADADPLTPLPPAVGYPPTRPYETAPPDGPAPAMGGPSPAMGGSPPAMGGSPPAMGGSPPAPPTPPPAGPTSPAGTPLPWAQTPGAGMPPGAGAPLRPAGPPPGVGSAPPALPPHPVRTRRPARPAKQPKVRKGGPVAPPGWRPPPGYVAVPVRRRRKWPWVLLLSVLCCCGVPGYYAQPFWEQYPASATTPATIADLSLRQDDASERTADRLRAATRVEYAFAEGTFAAVYGDGQGKRVTVFGATGLRFDPDGDVTHEIARLTDRYGLTEIRTVPADRRGEQRRCGVGADDGRGVVVCSWADHGSVGSGVFTRLDVEDSSRLLSQVRDSILTRG
jgi:hypothetical protein